MKKDYHIGECCKDFMKAARTSSQEIYSKETPYKRRNKELEDIVGNLGKKINEKNEEIN